jgi:hypothetical protein
MFCRVTGLVRLLSAVRAELARRNDSKDAGLVSSDEEEHDAAVMSPIHDAAVMSPSVQISDGESSDHEMEAQRLLERSHSAEPACSSSDMAAPAEPTQPRMVQDEGLVSACVICMDAPMDATIVHEETGHVCCCLGCAKGLQAAGHTCPVCRAPITAVIRHFVITSPELVVSRARSMPTKMLDGRV